MGKYNFYVNTTPERLKALVFWDTFRLGAVGFHWPARGEASLLLSQNQLIGQFRPAAAVNSARRQQSCLPMFSLKIIMSEFLKIYEKNG